MFTGLVKGVGIVDSWESEQGVLQIKNSDSKLLDKLSIGASIAVNGVCLTVTGLDTASFSVFVSKETIRCTTFNDLRPENIVNLEPCLTLQDFVGGHLVTGHVDGIAECTAITRENGSKILTFSLDIRLAKFVAKKGSVALDGVSLTVVEAINNTFKVMLIPHTMLVTTFKNIDLGSKVNIEVDLIARYCERLLVYNWQHLPISSGEKSEQ